MINACRDQQTGLFAKNAEAKIWAVKGILMNSPNKWIKIDAIAEVIYGEHEWPDCYNQSISAMIAKLKDNESMMVDRQHNKVRYRPDWFKGD